MWSRRPEVEVHNCERFGRSVEVTFHRTKPPPKANTSTCISMPVPQNSSCPIQIFLNKPGKQTGLMLSCLRLNFAAKFHPSAAPKQLSHVQNGSVQFFFLPTNSRSHEIRAIYICPEPRIISTSLHLSDPGSGKSAGE